MKPELEATRHPLSAELAEGDLSLARAASLLWAVAERVRDLHSAGSVHGRIEPCMIMVAGDEVQLQSAEPGAGFEDEVYAAPELAHDGAADARADVYALGVLLFVLLTGERPKGLEVPSELRKDLPDGGDEIFRACFVRAERRLADAGAFCEELLPVRIALEAQDARSQCEDPGPLFDAHLLRISDAATVASAIPKLARPQLEHLFAALPQPVLLARPEPEVDALLAALEGAGELRKLPAGSPLEAHPGASPRAAEEAAPPPRTSLLLSLGCLFLFVSVGLGAFHFSKPLWRAAGVGQSDAPDIVAALKAIREGLEAYKTQHASYPESYEQLVPQLRALGREDLERGSHGEYSLLLTPGGRLRAIPLRTQLPAYRSFPGQPIEAYSSPREP